MENETGLKDLDVLSGSEEVKSVANDANQLWNDLEACQMHDLSPPINIATLENCVMRFCIGHLPLKKNYCSQCETYIKLAQEEIFREKYGCAIARFRDFSSFIDNLAVSKTKSDFSTGKIIELKTLANERISLCYLLKNNSKLAVKHSELAIIQKPVMAQNHLWRAIANRQQNNISVALKCLSVFGALTTAFSEECLYSENEQKCIVMYWKMVVVMAQYSSPNVKVLHFPSNTICNLPHKDQHDRMSITFLMNYPEYNCLIQSDANSLHILPVGNGTFAESLQEQKQAFGFMHDQGNTRYFAQLPTTHIDILSDTSKNLLHKELPSDTAKDIWLTSAFINSTSGQMSFKPGKGLYEHLLYCRALVKEEQFEKVLLEYKSILADLAVFPVLSEEEWTDTLAVVVDTNVEMIESAIESIQEYNARRLESTRNIEQIKQWLELNERKFRAKKCQQVQMDRDSSGCYNCYTRPKPSQNI